MRIRERRYLGKTDAQWEAFCENLTPGPPGMTVCACHNRAFAFSSPSLYKPNGSQRKRHRRR